MRRWYDVGGELGNLRIVRGLGRLAGLRPGFDASVQLRDVVSQIDELLGDRLTDPAAGDAVDDYRRFLRQLFGPSVDGVRVAPASLRDEHRVRLKGFHESDVDQHRWAGFRDRARELIDGDTGHLDVGIHALELAL